MSAPAPRATPSAAPATAPPCLDEARRVLRAEAAAVEKLAEQLDGQFLACVDAILGCQGSVITCGIGKAGWIAQKVAATLASLGVASHFLHPAEAVHGDLGRVRQEDLLLMFSYSGETEEITRLLPLLQGRRIPLLAVTRSRRSSLGAAAVSAIELGAIDEACPLGLAPTASTAAMLAIGDALAVSCSRRQGFSSADFAAFHPGGSLGRKLTTAQEAMRPLESCRLAHQLQTVRQALISQHRPGRRSGAMLVVDDAGVLAGLFTDSDLSRILERQHDQALDAPLQQVMTKAPLVVHPATRLADVVHTLEEHRISELPVLDDQRRPLGIVDVTDLVGVVADPLQTAESAESERDAADSPLRILAFPNTTPNGSVDEA